MLNKRRYRIHFSANFDHEVEVAGLDINQLKLAAAEMAANARLIIPDATNLQCGWITITPISEVPPDAEDADQDGVRQTG